MRLVKTRIQMVFCGAINVEILPISVSFSGSKNDPDAGAIGHSV